MSETLIFIPARSGSKRIKNKNIRKINGKPLIYWTIKYAKKYAKNEDILVSSDSRIINQLSINEKVKFLKRPKRLSGDNANVYFAVVHALKKIDNKKKYKYIALLQPTSPFRSSKDLIKCFQIIKSKRLDAVWTVTKIDKKFNPIKVLNIKNNNLRYSSNNGSTFVSRQKLSESYIRNGIAYFFSRKSIMRLKKILPPKSGFLEIKKKLFNIDTIKDLKESIKLLSKKK